MMNVSATRFWTASVTWRSPGAPLAGHYRGSRAGHAINNALLRELFSDENNWELVEVAKLHKAPVFGLAASA